MFKNTNNILGIVMKNNDMISDFYQSEITNEKLTNIEKNIKKIIKYLMK